MVIEALQAHRRLWACERHAEEGFHHLPKAAKRILVFDTLNSQSTCPAQHGSRQRQPVERTAAASVHFAGDAAKAELVPACDEQARSLLDRTEADRADVDICRRVSRRATACLGLVIVVLLSRLVLVRLGALLDAIVCQLAPREWRSSREVVALALPRARVHCGGREEPVVAVVLVQAAGLARLHDVVPDVR